MCNARKRISDTKRRNIRGYCFFEIADSRIFSFPLAVRRNARNLRGEPADFGIRSEFYFNLFHVLMIPQPRDWLRQSRGCPFCNEITSGSR